MTGMGYDNPFADGAYIKKRIGTDLFLIFDIVRYGKHVDLSRYRNVQVLIRKENGLSRILTENVTIDGSRIGVQINAEDNRQQGLFMASVSYDVPSEDSETGFIHTVYDIPRAFEIVPLSTEETQGTLFVVSERDVKPQAGGRDGVDGHDGRLRMVNHGTNDTTFALRAGEMHVWGEIYSLNLSLADVDAGYVSEYAFKFSCPRDRGTTLVLPQGVKFADNVVVTPNAGKTYEGSIVEGILVLIAN
jgi:hypothetical protein